MAQPANKPHFGVVRYDSKEPVYQAWNAFSALANLRADNPDLLDNEFFDALLDTAHARFLMLFEEM